MINLNGYEAQMMQEILINANEYYQTLNRPSMMLKPSLTIDGNQWCALYGADLQDGVAGFGYSPADAYLDFDKNWNMNLPTKV